MASSFSLFELSYRCVAGKGLSVRVGAAGANSYTEKSVDFFPNSSPILFP
jgi:hypothetical protein